MERPVPAQTKVKSTVEFVCGCQYRTDVREYADEHVQRTGHSMIAQGVLKRIPVEGIKS
jgi:hypothetical protein